MDQFKGHIAPWSLARTSIETTETITESKFKRLERYLARCKCHVKLTRDSCVDAQLQYLLMLAATCVTSVESAHRRLRHRVTLSDEDDGRQHR